MRILRTAVVTLTAAASAPALATATDHSVAPGRPTHLTFRVNATAPPISGRIPTSLGFAAPGFSFDPRAVSRHCKREQAVLDECPAQSRIGSGVLDVHVASATLDREAHLSLDIYLQSKTRILAVAFIGGPKVVPAKVSTSQGFALSFDPLPSIPPFPGLTLTLDKIRLNVGTSRVVVTHERQRIAGTHTYKTIVRRTRYDLLHAPSRCSGGLSSSVTLGFAGGPSSTVSDPIACHG